MWFYWFMVVALKYFSKGTLGKGIAWFVVMVIDVVCLHV
jgi:hypothetical protein